MQNISSIHRFILEMKLILETLNLKSHSHIWSYAEMSTFKNKKMRVKREFSERAIRLTIYSKWSSWVKTLRFAIWPYSIIVEDLIYVRSSWMSQSIYLQYIRYIY